MPARMSVPNFIAMQIQRLQPTMQVLHKGPFQAWGPSTSEMKLKKWTSHSKAIRAIRKQHLSRLSKRKVRAIFSAPPWTHAEPLLREWNFVPSTYASSLNFSYTPIDAHMHLPVLYFVNSTNLDLQHHPFSVNPFTLHPQCSTMPWHYFSTFTSTLLWNSLPSPIRSASSLHTFRQDLQKYLGIPVIRPR